MTIITFVVFTKWWYTLPLDAPDTVFIGFPLPYVCNGWHTSMSLQFFIFEFLIDILTYFSIYIILILGFHRFIYNIKPHKILVKSLYSLAILCLLLTSFIVINPNHLFHIKRDFNIEIMETGYKFIWQNPEHSDYYTFHPEKKISKGQTN